jgi:hypothetical protein
LALLIEVVGVLALAAGIDLLAERGNTRPTAAGVAVIAVAVLGIAFWSTVWTEGKSLITLHRADAPLTLEQRDTAGGSAFAANEAFLAFAASHIPRRARVFLDCGGESYAPCGAENQWISFRLQPRVLVTHTWEAQWGLFYGVDPAREPFTRRWRIQQFGPKFGIAEAP